MILYIVFFFFNLPGQMVQKFRYYSDADRGDRKYLTLKVRDCIQFVCHLNFNIK